MSNITPGYPIIYRGSNVRFVKRMANLTEKQIYCNCVQEQYKKFVTAENSPQLSNAQRVSHLLSVNNGLGGKIVFGNNIDDNVKNKFKALNGYEVPAIKPIRNKY